MSMTIKQERKKICWRNAVFILGMGVVALIGVPIHIYYKGLIAIDFFLFFIWFVATSMSITIGYHRLFAHNAFQGNTLVRFLMVFLGSATFQQSVLEWSAQHRQHHGKVDQKEDPYNIREGFWHAHIGWLIFGERETNYAMVKDLSQYKLLVHQDKYYFQWATVCGLVIPIAVGFCLGSVMGTLLFSVAARITLVYHSTFSINSICHYFGKATFDPNVSAKDHWIVAFLTMGEGYHNFHHRFPNDYRNGVRWYHWDPSKWMIALFERLGWATKLHRTPREDIARAKTVADQIRKENLVRS